MITPPVAVQLHYYIKYFSLQRRTRGFHVAMRRVFLSAAVILFSLVEKNMRARCYLVGLKEQMFGLELTDVFVFVVGERLFCCSCVHTV